MNLSPETCLERHGCGLPGRFYYTVKPFLRDHCHETTVSILRYSRQKVLLFNITEPATKDHLSWWSKFLWPMGWSFRTGSTIPVPILQNLWDYCCSLLIPILCTFLCHQDSKSMARPAGRGKFSSVVSSGLRRGVLLRGSSASLDIAEDPSEQLSITR